jgi:hypothetical protein
MSNELRSGYKIPPSPAYDSTVPYLDCGMIVRCKTVPYIDKNQLSAADLRHLMIVQYRCCTVRLSATVSKISKFIVWRLNSTSKFSLTVVKTLKPVFKFSHRGVPLKGKAAGSCLWRLSIWRGR